MYIGEKHTHRRWSVWLASLTIVLGASAAHAQLGPTPADIPQSFIQPEQADPSAIEQQPTDANPSTSASVRAAMDELLIAKARQDAQTSQRPSRQSSLTPPLSQPIGTPKESPKSALLVGAESKSPISGLDRGYLQTIMALLGVLLLIVGLAQLYKRLARSQTSLVSQLGAGGSAPSGILEVIGRYPISKGMTLVVLKFDRRVLLLSHATGTRGKHGQSPAMELLCELSDPEEVASILIKSRTASGESIAQSFEQALREADQITDEHLGTRDIHYSEVNPVRFPSNRGEPVRTITTDEGDRAELWSSGQDSPAAAGVLRRRLSSMRQGRQG